MFFADPFEPFEFDDECDYYISVAPFEPFEFDDGCWEISVFFVAIVRHNVFFASLIISVPFEPVEFEDGCWERMSAF